MDVGVRALVAESSCTYMSAVDYCPEALNVKLLTGWYNQNHLYCVFAFETVKYLVYTYK